MERRATERRPRLLLLEALAIHHLCSDLGGHICPAFHRVCVWIVYEDGGKYLSAGRENFTTEDWERTFVESGPLVHGWEKEAE